MESVKGTRCTRDKRAGQLLNALRRSRGLSPEGLGAALHLAGLGFVSGRQIRRIERDGVIPTARVQFALARFFERRPDQIWMVRGLPPGALAELAREGQAA